MIYLTVWTHPDRVSVVMQSSNSISPSINKCLRRNDRTEYWNHLGVGASQSSISSPILSYRPRTKCIPNLLRRFSMSLYRCRFSHKVRKTKIADILPVNSGFPRKFRLSSICCSWIKIFTSIYIIFLSSIFFVSFTMIYFPANEENSRLFSSWNERKKFGHILSTRSKWNPHLFWAWLLEWQ